MDNQLRLEVRHDFTIYQGDNGYIVARYKLAQATDDLPKGSVVIAKGHEIPTNKNTTIVLEGNWRVEKNREGRSFQVSAFDIMIPTTKEGVVEYLCSLGIRIGKARAIRVYDKFGEKIWDVLETNPDEVAKVRGISKKMVASLKKRLEETTLKRKILMEFSSCEAMNGRKADKIIEKYGATALAQIHENPYLLCNINGFGFSTVDALAKAMPDYSLTRKERLAAGVQAVFQANNTKGHVCIPKTLAVADLKRTLQIDDIELCRSALNEAHQRKACRVKGDFCYSKTNFNAEKMVAANILRLLREKPRRKGTDGNKMDRYLDEFQEANGITLAEEQREAVKSCFTNNLSIITGGPGTGKSTIIKAILYVAEKSNPDRAKMMLMAPTGKAARRMEEATGHDASTIHTALGIRYSDDTMMSSVRGVMNDDEPLDADYVVVDEVSMIDQNLAECLFSRIGDTTSVVLVGDCDQLPSVGAGNVLAEMIRSELVPVHRLNVIFRQQDGDPIIINSRKIRDGITDL